MQKRVNTCSKSTGKTQSNINSHWILSAEWSVFIINFEDELVFANETDGIGMTSGLKVPLIS